MAGPIESSPAAADDFNSDDMSFGFEDAMVSPTMSPLPGQILSAIPAEDADSEGQADSGPLVTFEQGRPPSIGSVTPEFGGQTKWVPQGTAISIKEGERPTLSSDGPAASRLTTKRSFGLSRGFGSIRAAMPSLKETTSSNNQQKAVVISKGAKGFGFNLASSTARMPFGMTHYISKVDSNSPAEAAGMAVGDRIIEVEEAEVKDSSHQALIDAIIKFSKANRPLNMLLAPPDMIVKMTLEGKLKDGDIFVRDNMRPNDVNAMLIWRVGARCMAKEDGVWQEGVLEEIRNNAGQVGLMVVRLSATDEVVVTEFKNIRPVLLKSQPQAYGFSESPSPSLPPDDSFTDTSLAVGEPFEKSIADISLGQSEQERSMAQDDGISRSSTPGQWAVGNVCWVPYEGDDNYYKGVVTEIRAIEETGTVEYADYPGEFYTGPLDTLYDDE